MMRGVKKFLVIFAAIGLVLPSLPAIAQESGEISSKDEVVYAKLSAIGEEQELYVVNILDVKKAGKIVDYGSYSSLKNLTNVDEMNQVDNAVELSASEGKFYYQGNMNEEPLPWNISISYLLDGKEISPEELAGKDGRVQVKIATSYNDQVDSVFFNNYLLQVSLALNTDLFSNIEAPDGMLANAGKNKQVTFTVMPEKEEELVVEADVVDFELEGINITGIPSSMPIDAPDIDDMTGDLSQLTKAINKINNGVGDLQNGLAQINDGAKKLGEGSLKYKEGMTSISSSSPEIVSASKSISQALQTLNASLANGSEDMNLDDFEQLNSGLSEIAKGLRDTSDGLNTLKENYSTAYSTLNKAMEAIPEYEITKEQTTQLYNSGGDQAVLNQLLETYSAARTAKGTYEAVKQAFDAVNGTLEEVSGSLTLMADNLDKMSGGLSTSLEDMDFAKSFAQLQEAISQLSTNYQPFHSGLVKYTGGVNELSHSYTQIHNGIVGVSQGTNEIENGLSRLHDGTNELYESTADLPEQMKQEVDQMIDDFDKSDFEAVSFVSPENKKINSVQFVLKTESIKKEEKEEVKTEKAEEEKGFWAKLMDLF
ncbi:YhgE/Pip domain-containing protein [Metabacillus endolithicus]|uniref:YhgE/Pip domain-containing protein n=1 Tax=Metabacillus endolithicus TaxID=1535204 RepID=A0ABW5BWV8_9BACI|nr:YhgE/Pip domain-containing protein [Metabacillus endolithicus]UPG63947.1 YhgE/Pip domain-containing protein [Metabacillus endolithicus]